MIESAWFVRFSRRNFALVALLFLSLIAFVRGQVYTCPITRVPAGDDDESRAEAKPMPLPGVDPGGVTSAEYGTGNGDVRIPYTTQAVYGTQYNTGTSAQVVTSAPSKNMPYVVLVWLLDPEAWRDPRLGASPAAHWLARAFLPSFLVLPGIRRLAS